MTMREPCWVSEQGVLAFVSGDLEPTAELAVAEHLAECEGCREQAAEFLALGDVLPATGPDEKGAVRWDVFEVAPETPLYVAVTDRGLARVSWHQESSESFVRELSGRFEGRTVVRDREALSDVERELSEYFRGDRSAFDLPVDLSSLSDFERRVLEAARRIPFGQVVPYSELARRIGKPRAARAVGNALGHNPVAIVVPCHRVVRRDGGLGGYTGGLEYKERLLAIEGRSDLLAG